jgi:hypothetical protein
MPAAPYCERVEAGLWEEPLNALTNLAFLVAAWASWRSARWSRTLSTSTITLIVLILAIGAGSTVFHLFATPWARLLDALPILLFQLAFLWLYVRGVVGMRSAHAAIPLAVFAAAAWAADQFPRVLNGSLGYVPTLGLALGIGWHHWNREREATAEMSAAAGIFTLALLVRSLDRVACPWLPMGTHFAWHLMVPAALHLFMRALLWNLPGARAPRRSPPCPHVRRSSSGIEERLQRVVE